MGRLKKPGILPDPDRRVFPVLLERLMEPGDVKSPAGSLLTSAIVGLASQS